MINHLPFASWRALKNPNHLGRTKGRRGLLALLAALALVAAACGSDEAESDEAGSSEAESPTESASSTFSGTLTIGAIPDQDPELLQRLYGLLSTHLEAELPGVTVEYVPVTDYQGAVSAFSVGDLDLVWFGGLTGVQARLEVEGANALVQRDIDAEFTSVFIANTSAGVDPVDDVAGLANLEGRSLTFGSESSTSGRLMPQSFLNQAGLDIDSSFTGVAGFSGSHDATIALVAAGTYEVGALNSQVWDSRVADGEVDSSQVVEIFRTPPYFDYHWVSQPSLDDTFGSGFTAMLVTALTSLDTSNPDDAAVLELFGATAFIETENGNYAAIEEVARDIGAIR